MIGSIILPTGKDLDQNDYEERVNTNVRDKLSGSKSANEEIGSAES